MFLKLYADLHTYLFENYLGELSHCTIYYNICPCTIRCTYKTGRVSIRLNVVYTSSLFCMYKESIEELRQATSLMTCVDDETILGSESRYTCYWMDNKRS